MNIRGQPLFTRDMARREAYAGTLRVLENRVHRLGRVVTTATLTGVAGDIPQPVLELYDVTLLWLDGKTMRMRGFEDVDGTQFAQAWDIEVA